MAFKRLMVKRNQELNRQAIALFEKQQAAKNAPGGTDGAGPTEEAKVADGVPVGVPTAASGATNPTATMSKEEAAKQAAELKEVLKVV